MVRSYNNNRDSPEYLDEGPYLSDIEAQGRRRPKKRIRVWRDDTCTCLPGTVQLLVFVAALLTALIFIHQFVHPRPYDFQLSVSSEDEIIVPKKEIPVESQWKGILSDFWRRPSKVILPSFRNKGFIKKYWLFLLPFLWVFYLLLACCTRCCKCCRCLDCLWRPKRRDWYIFIFIWMLPIAVFRIELALTHSNDEYFHPDGNVLIIGDSWSVPGIDFMYHSKYQEGYALWPHKVAERLGTRVRGPNLTAIGYRAMDWAVEIKRFNIQAKKNDLVIIHLGGNDSRSSIPTVLWLCIRNAFSHLGHGMGCCEKVDYDAEIVKIMNNLCKAFIQDIERIVSHMKQLGFSRFLISEPPFHRNVPIIGLFNEWGLFDHNSTVEIKKNIQKNLQKFRKRHPKNIEIFEEMKYLDEIGLEAEGEERFYIDQVHASQKVHDKLTMRAEKQIRKAGWNNWKVRTNLRVELGS